MGKAKITEKTKSVGPDRIRRNAKPDKTKTDMIRARIDPELKLRVETILSHLDLSASDAIRLFYTQITLMDGLPFPVQIPNAETLKALHEADTGKLTRYDSSDEMFKKLGI